MAYTVTMSWASLSPVPAPVKDISASTALSPGNWAQQTDQGWFQMVKLLRRLPRSGWMLRWRLSLLGSLGPGYEFSPVRRSFCPIFPPAHLLTLFPFQLEGAVLLCFPWHSSCPTGIYKNLWDESEPGFSIRYILHSVTKHLFGLSACVRARNPAPDKILPSPYPVIAPT